MSRLHRKIGGEPRYIVDDPRKYPGREDVAIFCKCLPPLCCPFGSKHGARLHSGPFTQAALPVLTKVLTALAFFPCHQEQPGMPAHPGFLLRTLHR